MVATVAVIALVMVASITDLRRHKIYNWTTYPGILAALGLNALGDAAVRWASVDRARCEAWGWIGLLPSLYGLLACGGILLFCFVLFKVAGGDVKLIAMVGAFLGPQRGIEAMLWTFVICACLALIVLVWRVGPLRLAQHALRLILQALRLRRLEPQEPELRAELEAPLFLAPSALAAVVMVQFSLVQWL
jgi:prepilin peptidase CpaA